MAEIAGPEAINAVLWADWNPIGFPVPKDEYISYARELHGMLFRDGGDEEILAYLHQVEDQRMGLSVKRADADLRNRLILQSLRALKAR